MQQNICFFILCFLLSHNALAQKEELHRPVITFLPHKAQPTTAPTRIDESERRKECPIGFSFVGKQCAKTLTAEPSITCPPGTVRLSDECAAFAGKLPECPPGYAEINGICVRRDTVSPVAECPPGFVLTGKSRCTKREPLLPKMVCPAGTSMKGDRCVKVGNENPDYVCPPDSILVGRKCQREEIYDCTPPRIVSELPLQQEQSKGHGDQRQRAMVGLGLAPSAAKGKEQSHFYQLEAVAPLVEEYVIEKTCKRIIREDARAICPDGTTLNGKLCNIDIAVAPLSQPGGFRELTADIEETCPEGYWKEGTECVATTETLPQMYCPISHPVDLGDQCAMYVPTRLTCPEGFYLDGLVCTKTIFAAPNVEYTVTYACTGKDCATTSN